MADAASNPNEAASSDSSGGQDSLARNLSRLVGRSEEQHAFIDAMMHLHENSFDSNEQALVDAQELLPPEVLLDASCLKSTTLYVNLREVLRKHGVNVQRRQGLPVHQATATALYSTNSELMSTANSLISNWRLNRQSHTTADATHNSERANANSSGNSNSAGSTNECLWRRVDAANRRFQDSEKYSGILGESPNLSEARRSYVTYCDQKSFPRPDRVKLVSCVLKGPALSLWSSSIEHDPDCQELGAVFAKLESHFDTPAHQRQIEAMAGSLSLETIRAKNQCSRIAALGILYHEVSRLNDQFPVEKRGNIFKAQTLMKIAERYEWSRSTEEEMMRNAISYDELYTRLSASLVVWENNVSRSGQDPSSADDTRRSVLASSFIGFGSQYAVAPRRNPANQQRAIRDPSKTPSQYRQHNYNQPVPEKAARVQCFRCKEYGHFRSECPLAARNPMLLAAKSRIREIGGDPDAAAAQVLFELTVDEDASLQHDQPVVEDISLEPGTFETLLARKVMEDDNEADQAAQAESPDFGKPGGI